MKKLLPLALSLVMLFSVFGCNKQSEDGDKTLGLTLLDVFRENSDKSLQEIADMCLKHPSIEFMGSTMPVEPGALTGFDSDIDGFTEGVMFSPNIGTIPFIGYVFEAGDNAQTLSDSLKASANMRWNICTEAEETICESIDGKVFFLMCPRFLSE